MKNQLAEAELKKRMHERETDIRSEYYRDTTAIIHSSPFRRLKHKTQVFFAPSNDHICTRIEHVLHVASIASAICRGLNLDTELAWAIGMGHDLGHTPFGHVGEHIISQLMTQAGLDKFEHEVNSLRVVDFLAEHGKGLNLTYAVRDGIVSHCGEQFCQNLEPDFAVKDFSSITSRKQLIPSTWEGVVVRFSDIIAYLGRDFEDAQRLSIVSEEELPAVVVRHLGNTNGQIINSLVNDMIDCSIKTGKIGFSDSVFEAVLAMKKFNYEHIYKSPILDGYEKYFSRLIRLIVSYLQELFDTWGFETQEYFVERNMLAAGFSQYVHDMKEPYLVYDGNYDRLVFDYVSGMSDNFCLDCANEILKPEHLNDYIEGSLTGKWFDAVNLPGAR